MTNQKKVYLVQDNEGVFFVRKKLESIGLIDGNQIEDFILSVRQPLGLRTPLFSECALAQGQQIEHTNMN